MKYYGYCCVLCYQYSYLIQIQYSCAYYILILSFHLYYYRSFHTNTQIYQKLSNSTKNTWKDAGARGMNMNTIREAPHVIHLIDVLRSMLGSSRSSDTSCAPPHMHACDVIVMPLCVDSE